MSIVTFAAALLAAAAFAVAIPMEHRAADHAPPAGGLTLRHVTAFAGATLRDRWWLAGMVLNGAGFALHALALHTGGLAVVQPLLIASVLFALPVNHRMRRERFHPSELGWAAALAVGVSGFLFLATAGVPAPHEPVDRTPAVAAAALTLGISATLIATARRSGSTRAAVLLGVVTGVLFAVPAALLKVVTEQLASGAGRVLSGWQLYALVVVGVLGTLVNQLAYQAGPLSASLPAITVVNPLVSVLIGVVIFDERLRHTPGAIAGEVLSLLLLAAAGVALARLGQASAQGRAEAGSPRGTAP